MYTITPISQSPDLPVSVESVGLHLRLNDDSEDALIEEWIEAAEDLFQSETGVILMPSTHRLKLDSWPTSGIVQIPRFPVTSVDMISYLDSAGEWQELAGWTADVQSVPARVVLPQSVPTLAPDRLARINVAFSGGYAPGQLPKLTTSAIRLIVAHWYRVREAFGETKLTETPAGWQRVVNRFRTGIFGGIE